MDVPIAQGVLVPEQESSYQHQEPGGEHHKSGYVKADDQESGYEASDGGEQQQQEQQQPKQQFKDAIWAFFFLVHLVLMLMFLFSRVMRTQGGSSDGGSYGSGLVFLVGTGGVVGVGLSCIGLAFMLKFAAAMIKFSLFFDIAFLLLLALVGYLSGAVFLMFFGLIFAAITACYVKNVWTLIPFAAANLNTATTAVMDNMGLTVVAYGIMALSFVWTYLFFLGVDDILNDTTTSPYVLFVLLLSYYWVCQVLQNTIHVTVAGTIGTWWFVPSEATSGGGGRSRACWSQAITDSLSRATSYSFGSICLGSLIVATIQALRATKSITEDSEECGGMVNCIIDCILACIEDMIEYINKWAYIYVGLYGFGYVEAGKNVFQLFENKGWTVLITDDLAETCLWMVSMFIGLLTGFVTMLYVTAHPMLLGGLETDDDDWTDDDDVLGVAFMGFIVGFLPGYVFSAILMSVVVSAVNTVIVCYAESPMELQRNHPKFGDAMRDAWSLQYPEFDL